MDSTEKIVLGAGVVGLAGLGIWWYQRRQVVASGGGSPPFVPAGYTPPPPPSAPTYSSSDPVVPITAGPAITFVPDPVVAMPSVSGGSVAAPWSAAITVAQASGIVPTPTVTAIARKAAQLARNAAQKLFYTQHPITWNNKVANLAITVNGWRVDASYKAALAKAVQRALGVNAAVAQSFASDAYARNLSGAALTRVLLTTFGDHNARDWNDFYLAAGGTL